MSSSRSRYTFPLIHTTYKDQFVKPQLYAPMVVAGSGIIPGMAGGVQPPVPPSTTTTTTTTTAPPFDPRSISSLWSWYVATTGVTGSTLVTQWGDLSGNSHDMISVGTNYPEQVIDNVGTLSTEVIRKIEGSSAWMQATGFPSIGPSGVTMFIVAKENISSAVIPTWMSGGQISLFISNGSLVNQIRGKAGTNTPTYLQSAITSGSYNTVRLSASASIQSLSINNGTPITSSNASYLWLANALYLFTQNGSFAVDQGNTSFAEIIIYTSSLTPSNVNTVETYLKTKYNNY